jgi:O-antigen/teichoic acid export membrane protein
MQKVSINYLIIFKYFTTLLLFIFTLYKFKVLTVETMGEFKYFTTVSLLGYTIASFGLNQFLYKIKLLNSNKYFIFIKVGVYILLASLLVLSIFFITTFKDSNFFVLVLFFYTFVFFTEQIIISLNILYDENYKNIFTQLGYVFVDITIFSSYVFIYDPQSFIELLNYLLIRSLMILCFLIIVNKRSFKETIRTKVSSNNVKYFLSASFSFAVLTIIGYFSNNIDIYLLKILIGAYGLGIYSFILMVKANLLLGAILYIQNMTPLIRKNNFELNSKVFLEYRRKGMFAIFVVSFLFLVFYKVVIVSHLQKYDNLELYILIVSISTFLYTLTGANGTILSLHGLQKYNIYSEIVVISLIIISFSGLYFHKINNFMSILVMVNISWNIGNLIRMYFMVKENILKVSYNYKDLLYLLFHILLLFSVVVIF